MSNIVIRSPLLWSAVRARISGDPKRFRPIRLSCGDTRRSFGTHIHIRYEKDKTKSMQLFEKKNKSKDDEAKVDEGMQDFPEDASKLDEEEVLRVEQKVKSDLKDLEDRDIYWEYHQKDLGWVYDKKPHKVHCKAGKIYMWCACGHSHKQPFCDGTHRHEHFKITLKPIPFTCKETKDYWFCNCKQTKSRPFCDGTHQTEAVQESLSTVKSHQIKGSDEFDSI